MRNYNVTDSELDESFEPVQLPDEPGDFLTPEETSLGARDDGLLLLYRGKLHTVVAETEAGKSWLALAFCVQEIDNGHNIAYVDFEDSIRGIIGRLASLVEWRAIREHFNYIQPEAPLTSIEEFAKLLNGCTLVILDGITEAMSLQGLDGRNENDIATFNATWIKPLTHQGTAVLSLDHVVKNREARGRNGIGSVHKINGVDGAQFVLINREPFGRGRRGNSGLYVAKDRPGYLRQHGIPGQDKLIHIADLALDARDSEDLRVSLDNPEQAGPFRPTVLMERISRTLKEAGEPLSKNAICRQVTGNRKYKFLAIDQLVSDGYAELDQQKKVKHLKSYCQEQEDDDDV